MANMSRQFLYTLFQRFGHHTFDERVEVGSYRQFHLACRFGSGQQLNPQVEMDGGIDRFKFDTFRFLTLNDAQRNLSQRGNVTAHGVRVECHFLDTFVQLVQLVFRHLARHHGTYRRGVEPFLDDGQIVQVGQFGIDARLRVGNRLDVAFKLLF